MDVVSAFGQSWDRRKDPDKHWTSYRFYASNRGSVLVYATRLPFPFPRPSPDAKSSFPCVFYNIFINALLLFRCWHRYFLFRRSFPATNVLLICLTDYGNFRSKPLLERFRDEMPVGRKPSGKRRWQLKGLPIEWFRIVGFVSDLEFIDGGVLWYVRGNGNLMASNDRNLVLIQLGSYTCLSSNSPAKTFPFSIPQIQIVRVPFNMKYASTAQRVYSLVLSQPSL